MNAQDGIAAEVGHHSPPSSRRAREQGMAVITALVCFFVVMMAGTSVLSFTLMRESAAKSARDVRSATLLAESGIDHALYEIQLGEDSGGDGVGNGSGTLSNGTYVATVRPAFAGPGKYTITATGTVRGTERRLVVDVSKEVVRTGFVGRSGVTMSGGQVDSYDSSAGTYESQLSDGLAGAAGRLASNGNIDLSGAATIHGDATPGPGMHVNGNTRLVAGSITPARGTTRLTPFVYLPPIAPTGAHNGSGTFGTGIHRFTSFTVPAHATVTFSGDVKLYVDGDFSIADDARGILNSSGTLTIFHNSGDFALSGDGIINQDQRPSSLQVFSATTGNVRSASSTAVHAVIYAPRSNGIIQGTGDFHGSFEADVLTLSGGAKLHYDIQLDAWSARFTLGTVRPQRE